MRTFGVAAVSLMMMAMMTPSAAAAEEGRHELRGHAARNAPWRAGVERAVQEALRAKLLTGAVVGVAQRGHIDVLAFGSANLEHQVPLSAETVFRIGSLTKQFTAALTLLLAEDGRLKLDDKLSQYFPEFPDGGKVTLRQLLTHTSGIRNYTSNPGFEGWLRRDVSTDQLVQFIGGQEKLYDFAPGSAWAYNNSGFILLGAVLEKVSGQPYEALLKKRIIEPLGLTHTAMDNRWEIVPHRAAGYERWEQAPSGFVNTGFLSLTVAAAAGGIRSTAEDLLKWHEALFSGKLLKPASFALMTEPARLNDGRLTSEGRNPSPGPLPMSEFGFGLAIDVEAGRRAIGHSGSINGFNGWLQTYPDQNVSVVVLTNTSGGAFALTKGVTDAIFSRAGDAR